MAQRRGQKMPDEGPSESDLETFGGVTRECPECKAELFDDAEVCWKCGHALSGRSRGQPMWAVVTAVVLIVTIMVWWVAR